ncbi:MAG: hypothetical protein MK033_00005 [Candidatus Caenarcaniphilales bacterium]|nr:hypothetical protein [Candidatus Caenarcaniphilales bacterium]
MSISIINDKERKNLITELCDKFDISSRATAGKIIKQLADIEARFREALSSTDSDFSIVSKIKLTEEDLLT